ncbi:MAG: WD40 repeat domain-containing protein [Candidatus Poribacteria bacterium]|nr:WD40 repeat domain-containing protein [Candidatus Poribacteria bacterium]
MQNNEKWSPAIRQTKNSDITTWELPDSAISRLGQGGIMSDIAYSLDGKHFVFGSTIGVWWYDLSTITPIALWDTDRGIISVVSISPDGQWLATGDGDGLVKVWDVQRGVCVAQMERNEDEKSYHIVSQLVFSPDSQRLAVSSNRDYILYVYHPATGECLAKLYDDPNKFRWRGRTRRPIAFSADGSLLACTMPDESLMVHADSNGEIRFPDGSIDFIAVWDVEAGEQIACLTDTERFVQSLCFSPCGRFLASGRWGGPVFVWSVADWQRIHSYHDFGTGRMQVFYSPSGVLHAAQRSDDTFVVWDVARREKCELSVEVQSVLQGAHVPKGTPFVLPFYRPREFRKWTGGDSEPCSFQHLHTGVPTSLVFTSDGKTLAAGYWNDKVRLWDMIQPSSPPSRLNLSGESYVVSESTQGKIYAAGSCDGKTAEVWDIGNIETPIATFKLPDAEKKSKLVMSTVVFAPKTNLLACGDSEGTMYVWDVQQQHIRHKIKAHTGWIDFIGFSPDEKNIVSKTESGLNSRLWDVENGEPIEAFPERNYAFAFSPCSTLIVLGRREEILLWDINCRETVMSILPPKDSWSPFALAFSPCGHYFASGATWMRNMNIKKCSVRLWNVANGENIATFRGHPTDVQCLTFSPDGTILASGGYDGTILFWDLKPYINS